MLSCLLEGCQVALRIVRMTPTGVSGSICLFWARSDERLFGFALRHNFRFLIGHFCLLFFGLCLTSASGTRRAEKFISSSPYPAGPDSKSSQTAISRISSLLLSLLFVGVYKTIHLLRLFKERLKAIGNLSRELAAEVGVYRPREQVVRP